jgi:Tol biopolymer transport system component
MPNDDVVFGAIGATTACICRTDASDPSAGAITVVELGGPSGIPGEVRVSPDGSIVAYVVSDFVGDHQGLWVADLDGGRPVRIADVPEGFAWSPQGDRLVVGLTASGRGDSDVFVYDAVDGTLSSEPVVGSALDEFDPSWTPDGSRIVFVRSLGGGTNVLVWIHPDRSGEEPVPGMEDGVLDADPRTEPPVSS